MLRGHETRDPRARLREWWASRAPGAASLRWDPGRPAILSVVLVVGAVLGVGLWWLRHDQPAVLADTSLSASAASTGSPGPVASAQTASAQAGSAPAATSSGPTASESAARVVVDVVGRVRRPGVYRLPVGARVEDALRAAGGALGGFDLATVNLARRVADGEQIAVGVVGAVALAPATSETTSGAGGVTGPLDLNAATAAQLDALPGVGPVLAQRIVDWRAAHGRFSSVDQLNQVSGVGDAKFADLKALVTVG